jgi:MerR HTH family regulatory protein
VSVQICSLSEIAERLRRAFSLPDATGVTQSLRYWVNNGLVRPSGPIHTGRGRDRVFEHQEILRAALVYEMTRWNVTVGTMKTLLQQIDYEVAKDIEGNLIEFLELTEDKYFKFWIWGHPNNYVLRTPGRPTPFLARSSLSIDARKLKKDLGL